MDNSVMPSHSPNGAYVHELYRQSQVNYGHHFVALYIAYNAWYRSVTHASTDREALSLLKKRFIIWEEYRTGRVMCQLRIYMEKLSELTQREPLQVRSLRWSGEIESADAWQSLIEFWYRVRCLLVHGSSLSPSYVWLAYESLNIFMAEVTERMAAVGFEHVGVDMKYQSLL